MFHVYTKYIVSKFNDFYPFQFRPSIIVHWIQSRIKTLILIHFSRFYSHTPFAAKEKKNLYRLPNKWRTAAERKRGIQKENRHTKPNQIRKWQCYYLKEYQTSSDWKPFLSRPIWPQLSWAMTHVRIFICPCGVSYRTFIHHNSSHPVSVHLKTFPLPQSISTTCNRISHTFTIQIHFTHKHNVHSGWSYE